MHYRNHDALWKGLLQTFFPEFLELTLPEVAGRLKPAERRFLEQEAFTDPPDGRQALVDLLAEVPARDGAEEVVLIHVEVEREFGNAMDRRMWRYFAHLSLKYDNPIVPIVLFLRGGPGGLSERQVDHRAAGLLVNRFRYWSIGLSGFDARSLLSRPPLGPALAACARGDRLPRGEQKYLCMEAVLRSHVSEAQEQLLITAIETYLELNEEQKMKYADRVARSPYRSEVQEMELTWAGKLHEKGLLQGRHEGRQEGLREGVDLGRRMLLKLLERRFGELPGSLTETIRGLEEPALIEKISDRALAASDLAEVEALLRS